MISTSCIFNTSSIYDIYDSTVFDALEKLLLKHDLVQSGHEFDSLYRCIVTKKSDFTSDFLILKFVCRFTKLFKKNGSTLDQNELNSLFEILLDLFSWCSEENLNQFAFEIYTCFECISSYHIIKTNVPVQLSMEIHLKAFEICRDMLINREMNFHNIKSIVYALAHIINHKEFTVSLQMAFVNLIQSVAIDYKILLDIKIGAFNICSTSEHACPYFFSVIIDKLLDYTQRKKMSIDTRILSMEKLPFNSYYFNVTEEARIKAINVLVELTLNKTEDIAIRKNAAKKLSTWIWFSPKFQYNMCKKQKYIIDALIKLITESKTHQDEIYKDISNNLFENIRTADQSNPICRYLCDQYKVLINDNDIPMDLKLNLIMPKINCDLRHEEPYGIDLFLFMLEKLSDANHPMELKKIYVQRLISCYLSKKSCNAIADRNKSIGCIEDFLKLEIFKIDDELGLTSRKTYNELFLKIS